MTPRARSSEVSWSSLLRAPRSLYAAVNWRFSNFSQTSAPMISDSVLLTSIGVRITAPSMRCAAARMSSMLGGCMLEVCNMQDPLDLPRVPNNAMPTAMRKTIFALAAALLASSAGATTLIINANGVQSDAQSQLQHFTGILIGDDGKIVRVLRSGEAQPRAQVI